MIAFFKSLYLNNRFFYALFGIILLFLLSKWIPQLYVVAWFSVLILFLVFLAECIALYKENSVNAERILPEKFSNSDPNKVVIQLENQYRFPIKMEIIDEIPKQFQKRDFLKCFNISAKASKQFSYELTPVERGEYIFGYLNCYATTKINLIKRKYRFNYEAMVKVYPSFVQMKRYDFLTIDQKLSGYGLKKIRKLGHTLEFEQIKEYVLGDDVRTINWKATAKHNQLMVNQYQDEKSQPIYSIIDLGRVMQMPFNGLSLLDYSINSSLAFSNIGLKKNDKVGLMTFSNTIGKHLPATSKKTQLTTILEHLYNIETDFKVSDFGLLYAQIKRKITQRSLLLLYTNFEHISALRRQLPYLKAISKKHLLVVVFFENTELEKLTQTKSNKIGDIYDKTIAESFAYDKKLMVKELEKSGIKALLTPPKSLSINTINAYLEIKAKGSL
ncbi:MAG: DUF58 domain-containing protein [Bacteroidota bacterium]